jgi:4-hydroxybenzoate polyprenyltransferase
MPPTAPLPDAAPANWVDRRAPETWRPWLKLGRFDRPTGIWLLMLPGWQGIALAAAGAGRAPSLALLAAVFVGAALMRAAGCAYNDIVDRDFDAKVARTRGRPIPSGAVGVWQAAAFLVVLCLIGLAILIQFNRFAVALGAASLLLVAAYPFMKRITWWPQAWLGLTFNWGAILGFAAQTGRIDTGDILLYAGLFFWTLGYDTIYAHQDKEDDELIGVKSTARLLGANSRVWILRFYAVCFTLVLAAGFTEHAGWPFAPLMLLAGAHMLWQVRRLDIDDPENCLRLFRSNRETGALIALAMACASWFG